MAFEPDKITKQHILDAIKKIENTNIALEPSTRFDVIINSKPYPPKEVMRYAHELMNGEHIWERSGGEPTNKYLIALGFEIINKADSALSEQPITGNIWKLGCNWDKGNPSFYDLIKDNEIVIGVEDKKYSIGDLILITEGFNVMSIAKILEYPQSVTDTEKFKNPFENLKIPFEDWVNIYNVEWYELDEDERFLYRLQQGICRVNPNHEVYQQAIKLWNDRNSSYWIFQGNPNAFDFETAIRNNLLEEWTVSAHKDKIKVGDKVILWISGKNSGCYSLAEITSEPQIISNSKDSHLWKTEDKNPLKAGIKITHNLIDNPILLEEIKRNKELGDLKIGNQGTNFTATKKEYKIILELAMNKNIPNPELSTNNQAEEMSTSKNIILYGPPGTGKTYNSIDKAVEIATPDRFVPNNHPANKIIFDELRETGQIEFVTFHQNYSYEDFMIGLRPDAENEQLRFRTHKGVFYKIAKRARDNYFASKEKTSLSRNFDEVLNEILSPLVNQGIDVDIKMASGISYKINDVSDYSIHFKKAKGDSKHSLSIQTLEDIVEGRRSSPRGIDAYYNPLIEKIKEMMKPTEGTKTETLKSFILVIDEINRANISKVFGELITLLEDDKRLGKENELKITLPNGEKDFGVPKNIYIIGTMNTADKSIALIDIALRRRFEFIGYYPKYEGYDSDASSLLQKINEAIFKEKKSADYLIGHAYFMKQQTIKSVLQNKVVPLLMEYFSGKTEIVSRIFADTIWNVNYNTTNYSWDISPK